MKSFRWKEGELQVEVEAEKFNILIQVSESFKLYMPYSAGYALGVDEAALVQFAMGDAPVKARSN